MGGLSLEIVEGPGAGRRVEVGDSVEIGRDPNAGFHVDDDLVSRRHARVTSDDGAAYIEDLGSLNGTFVNGNQVKARTRLQPGDDILIGVTLLELRSAQDVVARPTAVRPVPPPLAIPPRPPDYIPRPVLEGDAPAEGERELDSLLDVRTKARARLAPLALALLVVFAVLIFLATR